jgi:hypothetical protein
LRKSQKHPTVLKVGCFLFAFSSPYDHIMRCCPKNSFLSAPVTVHRSGLTYFHRRSALQEDTKASAKSPKSNNRINAFMVDIDAN